MAAAKRLSDQLSDITECPICVETFTDPKVLPCVHTFCLKCLLKYGEHDKPRDQVACPLCRATFAIPPGGFADLPNNCFINKLLLISEVTQGKFETQACDICPEKEIGVKATAYCVECSQHICATCCKRHGKLKFAKSHQVLSLKDKASSEVLLKMTASYCAKHHDEQIKLYCHDCKQVTCVLCHVTDHQKYMCSDIQKSAEEFRKQLDDDIEKVTSCAQQSRDRLQQLERDSEGFFENLAATQQAISALYEKLK